MRPALLSPLVPATPQPAASSPAPAACACANPPPPLWPGQPSCCHGSARSRALLGKGTLASQRVTEGWKTSLCDTASQQKYWVSLCVAFHFGKKEKYVSVVSGILPFMPGFSPDFPLFFEVVLFPYLHDSVDSASPKWKLP